MRKTVKVKREVTRAGHYYSLSHRKNTRKKASSFQKPQK
jgi:hypothetical protein